MTPKVRILVVLLISLNCFCLKAQPRDSITVLKSVTRFVKAFNEFDWTNFEASFTDDATIFFPFWNQSKRIRGKQAIDSAWLTIFPEFTDIKNTRRLQITPIDINIQVYQETAIVTFHLGDGVKTLSRRTLVMIKENKQWKIAHLHASVISEGKN